MNTKLHLVLILDVILIIKSTYSTDITILHASNYDGDFEPLPNQMFGQLAGGLARVKQRIISKDPATFIFTGNFIRTPYEQGKLRLKAEAALLDYLKPEVVVLGNNEYSMTSENLKWFLQNTGVRIVSTNVEFKDNVREIGKAHQIAEDIRIVSYNMKNTSTLPSAKSYTVKDPLLTLNSNSFENKNNLTIAVGCAGFNEIKDMILATENIQVFVTGCSKSVFQWHLGDPLPPEGLNLTHIYPHEMTNYKGKRVLVAHSYGSTKFIGKLILHTDGKGALVSHESKMIYLSEDRPADPNIDALISKLKEREVAKSLVLLNGKCGFSECNLGNLITDAFIQYKVNILKNYEFWTDVSIALMPAGNINASIDASSNGGYITMEDLPKVMPKKQNLVTVNILGRDLKKSIELALRDTGQKDSDKFLQVSGLIIRHDSNKAIGQRLVIRVRCAKCKIPSYSSLNPSESYKLITTANLAAGEFGHYVFGNSSKIEKKESITDFDAFHKYILALKLIRISRSDRIHLDNQKQSLGNRLKAINTALLGMICLYYLIN